MTETELNCSVNHNYREGYEQGMKEGKEIAVQVNEEFVYDCLTMAEKNWTPNQVQMLKWLFGAVCAGKEFAEFAIENMEVEK